MANQSSSSSSSTGAQVGQSSQQKLDIDDTQPLMCELIGTEMVDDHIEYLIRVQRGYDSKYSWQVKKRYNDFDELFKQLRVFHSELPLPPKKAFGNKSREFLSIRQTGLQVNLKIY